MARLVALMPQPRMHRTRFHGVFAPHSKLRGAVTPTAGAWVHRSPPAQGRRPSRIRPIRCSGRGHRRCRPACLQQQGEGHVRWRTLNPGSCNKRNRSSRSRRSGGGTTSRSSFGTLPFTGAAGSCPSRTTRSPPVRSAINTRSSGRKARLQPRLSPPATASTSNGRASEWTTSNATVGSGNFRASRVF